MIARLVARRRANCSVESRQPFALRKFTRWRQRGALRRCRCRWPAWARITGRQAHGHAPLDGGNAPPQLRGGNGIAVARRYLVINSADLTTVKVMRTDSNDIFPMWAGDKCTFFPDRNGPMTLFRYIRNRSRLRADQEHARYCFRQRDRPELSEPGRSIYDIAAGNTRCR
jgi:hypothetical protein